MFCLLLVYYSRLAQIEKGSVSPRSLSCGKLRMASKFRFPACWNRRRRPFPCCAQKHNPPSSPMVAGIAPIRPSPYSNRAPLKPTAFASGRAVLPPRIRISKVRKSLLPSAPAPSKWSSRTPAISCILAMHFIFRPMYRTDTAILFPNHRCSPQCFPTAAPIKNLRFLHKASPPPIWKRGFYAIRQ